MDITKMIGSDKINTLSDRLFQSDNIKGITIRYNSKIASFEKYKTWGYVEFKNGDLEGKRNFEGNTIFDVLQQMMKFCKTIK